MDKAPYISNKLLISILSHFFLLLVVFLCVDSKYGTTDDLEMEMILSGRNMLIEPSYYLRYTHIFIGYFLYQLYQLSAETPWYGLYLLSSAITGLAAILYAALSISNRKLTVLFHVLVIWSHAFFFLIHPQFTSSALLIHFGALSLLYASFVNTGGQKRYIIIYILMSIWGGMMRIETFYLAGVISIPLLFSYTGFNFKRIGKVSATLGVSFLLTTAINSWHYHIQNKDHAWKSYNAYNTLLAGQQILDYKHPAYQWSESTADDYYYRVGWNYEDYMLFKQWFIADTTIYNLKAFQGMDYSFGDCGYPNDYIFNKAYDLFLRFEFNDYVYGCIIIFLLMIILSHRSKSDKWRLLLSLPIISAIICYLYIMRHLPDRVLLPLGFYFLIIAALNHPIITNDDTSSNKHLGILAILCLSLCLPQLKQSTYQQHQIEEYRNVAKECIDSLARIDSNMVLIGIPSFLSHPYIDPYQSRHDSLFESFHLLDIGHHANSPNHQAMLAQMEIDDMHLYLIEKENAYFIHRSDNTILPWYLNYLYRTRGVYSVAEKKYTNPSLNVTLYKISAQSTQK